jgi:hypothetical protein
MTTSMGTMQTKRKGATRTSQLMTGIIGASVNEIMRRTIARMLGTVPEDEAPIKTTHH